ncbi:MAG: hypothetical protein QM669_06105 [Siphonobacter sp.]
MLQIIGHYATSQTYKLSGKIKDKEGLPVIGASVTEKGQPTAQ